jgi:transcriptional regulator with XRE-family HTH domain
VKQENYFARNMEYLISSKGLSHAKVGAAIGVQRSTVTGYVTGDSDPNINRLFKIAEYFDIPAPDLLGTDLGNVHLIDKKINAKNREIVHPNVHPIVNLKGKKGLSEPCQECSLKDIKITSNEALIRSQEKHILSLKEDIDFLRNELGHTSYSLNEGDQRKPPAPHKGRKSAKA